MKERRQLGLPDRRQHTYAELKKRLDEHIEVIEVRLHRFFKKALFIFAVIGITSAISIFGFGITLSQIKDTRRDFVRDTCLAQNHRNRATVAEFYRVAKELKKQYPNRAAEIDQSVKTNLRLINTLAPRQNCEKLSQLSVGEDNQPKPVLRLSKETP